MSQAIKFGNPALTFPGDGSIIVTYDDGSSVTFDTATAMSQYIQNHLPDIDGVKALALANRLANDPLMNSLTLWNGKTFTLNPEAVAVGSVFTMA